MHSSRACVPTCRRREQGGDRHSRTGHVTAHGLIRYSADAEQRPSRLPLKVSQRQQALCATVRFETEWGLHLSIGHKQGLGPGVMGEQGTAHMQVLVLSACKFRKRLQNTIKHQTGLYQRLLKDEVFTDTH